MNVCIYVYMNVCMYVCIFTYNVPVADENAAGIDGSTVADDEGVAHNAHTVPQPLHAYTHQTTVHILHDIHVY